MSNVITPQGGSIRAEIVVIGSGPGGAVTATLLAEAGHDVLLVEEGAYLRLHSAPHFSQQEMLQKYRNAGITVGMGKANVAYVEGRCVGGGSEINRGLYHRTPEKVLESWSKEYGVAALLPSDLEPHFDACEATAQVSYLRDAAPPISRKLHDGATSLGWESVEVPRLVRYDANHGPQGVKQSMSETFVPRFLAAGGTLLPGMRVRRLARRGTSWEIRGEYSSGEEAHRPLTIRADNVFVACGAIQTPALLRRSGLKRNVGNTLRFHPMIKVVARFPEEVNISDAPDPVHQIKEFDPRFSLGCSMSARPALALAMTDHPTRLGEVDSSWRHMAIYYAQSTGGAGVVRNVPGFRDPLVRLRFESRDLNELAEGVSSLSRCLFAAGAEVLYPSITGIKPLSSTNDLDEIPADFPPSRANLQTLHLFSTCPMGEDESRCVTNSFGGVIGADGLFIADASLLCGPTVVNPQGTVMAVAHRNALHFLEQQSRRQPPSRARWQQAPTKAVPYTLAAKSPNT